MLQTTTNINIDFYDKKYILINAKQFDRKSIFLSVTCYDQGKMVSLNDKEYVAYIRYKKPDNYSVYNFCEINRLGKIIVEITEQMLVSDGISCADLVIVQRNEATVNLEPIEIDMKQDVSILSTMTIHFDVSESPVANSNVESSYEFNLVNEKLNDVWSYYEDIIKTSKSYAVGGTDKRENENKDNAKYYYEQSLKNAANAKASEQNAKTSETNAKESETNTSASEANAKTSEENSLVSEQNAKVSEINAKTSETNAATSEANAKVSENNADDSEANAKASETKALASEQNAKVSENNALNSANRSQSYAVGGTGTRDDEDTDNAYYYYELIKNIVVGLDSGFIPMGTVSFSELATVEKATGYIYNISDDFVTNESFREGAGRSYTAGTNVYYTANGEWDCFGGAASPTATVSEVKDYLGI